MHSLIRTIIGLSLLLSSLTPALAARHADAVGTQQRVAVVKALVSAANTYQLATTSRFFTSTAVLQIGVKQWRGQGAIESWWRTEFTHKLHITLQPAFKVKGNTVQDIARRTTKGGDCPHGCWDVASWQLSGARIARMTLSRFQAPPPPPSPPGVPPPPTIPPSP